jgi:hypothetical protein
MASTTVRTSAQLKEAIRSKTHRIRVEGPLADKVKRTLLIPKLAFAAASAAAGVAIYSLATAHEEIVYAPLTGGGSAVVRFGASTTAIITIVSLLGPTTAWSLIGVGVAVGGLSAVKVLRKEYRIETSGSGFIVLVRT